MPGIAFLKSRLRLSGHRTESKILAMFLIVSVVVFGLGWIASEVLEGDTLAMDRAILLGLRSGSNIANPIGPRWLTKSLIDLTALGSVAVLTVITTLAAGFLVALRKYATAVFVVAAVISGAILNSALKTIFLRPRPTLVPHLVDVSSESFPSGHAMYSALVYLTLAALLARSQPALRVRIYLMSVAIFLTLVIGFSRVFLGVHWPSDVVEGWGVGAAWAALCSLVAKSLQRRRTIEAPNSR